MYYRQYLQETISQEAAEKAASGGITNGEKISRNTLEEEARESSLRGHGTAEERYVLEVTELHKMVSETNEINRFWQRQRGQGETIAMGRSFINKTAPNVESKKEL